MSRIYKCVKSIICVTFCISLNEVKPYLSSDLISTLARLDVNDFPHGALWMRAELSPVFGAGSCKSALDSSLGRLRCRWHTRCRTDDVTRCVPVSLSANRSEPVWCSSARILLHHPLPSTLTDLLKLPNPSFTLSSTSMHFDTFFFIFCWKWVRQPIHWSINSGLFYQYIWLIYKCIMLKQKRNQRIRNYKWCNPWFFFLLHSLRSPVKWVTGAEPEMCTWGLYVSKSFKYQVQKHL